MNYSLNQLLFRFVICCTTAELGGCWMWRGLYFCSFDGGVFRPWSTNSSAVLRIIILCILPVRVIWCFCNLDLFPFYRAINCLCVCPWRYNSQMLLHHLNLLPGSPLWKLGAWHLISCMVHVVSQVAV